MTGTDSWLPGLWMLGDGPEQDVVVSSRMRLARNVEGFRFKSRQEHAEAGDSEDERLVVRLREALAEAGPGLRYVSMTELGPTQREVLFERHLVSAEHVNDKHARGVAYSTDGTTSVMLNEEDHLRLQVFAPGLELGALDERVNALDDALAERLAYSFNSRYGYLTSCPTNTGTGLRVSVMLHLPALSFRGADTGSGSSSEKGIVRVHKAAQRLGLTVRGAHGESSRAEGDFYQISNQVTLGRSPQEAVADLQSVLDLVINFERKSREYVLKDDRTRIEDVVWRAWAILCHARRITSREALAHLSALRLGVWLGVMDRAEVSTLHALMVRMQPGHLQHEAGRELQPAERDVVRAELIRDNLQKA